jgi:O-antigen ligase
MAGDWALNGRARVFILPAQMNRQRIDQWCERGILWLVLSILVIGPLATGGAHTFDFLTLQFLAAASGLLWVARLWTAERPSLLWPLMSWAVCAFLLLAIGRYLTADIELVARIELTRVVVYTLVFFLIVNNLNRQDHAQIISVALVCLAMGVSFYALFQFFTKSNQVWAFISPYKNRASGTYISPNHLAGFLEMTLPLALAYSMAGRMRASMRILIGYAAVVILAAIAVTLSRGGWLGAMTACFLFIFLLLGQKQYRIPALVALATLSVGALTLLPHAMSIRLRLGRMFASSDLNENTRFAIWEPALRMWRDHPLWGVGPGHFDSIFRAYRPQGVQLQPDWVHNDYLNTLTDWGLIGTGIVLAAWILLFVGLLKTWRSVKPQNSDLGPVTGSGRFAFTAGSTSGLAAILAHSWFDFNMHIPANAILCVTLMALLAGHIRFASRRCWHSPPVAGRIALSLAILAASGWLMFQGARRAREASLLNRAAARELFSRGQVDVYKMAFAAEPMNADTAYQIGEALRVHSLQGAGNYRALAEEAMLWYGKCMALNKWNGYGFLRYGMCLDWVGRKEESEFFFAQANSLDPSGYFTAAHVGLHYVQLRNYPAALQWFERSIRLSRNDNQIASSYIGICQGRMLEASTNAAVSLDFVR